MKTGLLCCVFKNFPIFFKTFQQLLHTQTHSHASTFFSVVVKLCFVPTQSQRCQLSDCTKARFALTRRSSSCYLGEGVPIIYSLHSAGARLTRWVSDRLRTPAITGSALKGAAATNPGPLHIEGTLPATAAIFLKISQLPFGV